MEQLYWTSIYNKQMERIFPYRRKIEDLDTDHIFAIFAYQKRYGQKLKGPHRKRFKQILWSRLNTLNFAAVIWLQIQLFFKYY